MRALVAPVHESLPCSALALATRSSGLPRLPDADIATGHGACAFRGEVLRARPRAEHAVTNRLDQLTERADPAAREDAGAFEPVDAAKTPPISTPPRKWARLSPPNHSSSARQGNASANSAAATSSRGTEGVWMGMTRAPAHRSLAPFAKARKRCLRHPEARARAPLRVAEGCVARAAASGVERCYAAGI